MTLLEFLDCIHGQIFMYFLVHKQENTILVEQCVVVIEKISMNLFRYCVFHFLLLNLLTYTRHLICYLLLPRWRYNILYRSFVSYVIQVNI